MKVGTVQINWHGTKPVLTLDFHPTSGTLATGGADYDIKVLPFPLLLFLFLRIEESKDWAFKASYSLSV